MRTIVGTLAWGSCGEVGCGGAVTVAIRLCAIALARKLVERQLDYQRFRGERQRYKACERCLLLDPSVAFVRFTEPLVSSSARYHAVQFGALNRAGEIGNSLNSW